jgi:hypothetical protein
MVPPHPPPARKDPRKVMEISDDLPSFAPLETDRTPTRSPDFSIEELQLPI